MTNPNSKSRKYSTPRMTTAVVPANYCILSIGQGMRVLMKKLLGYLLLNSDMLLNWSQISTLHTQPNLALCQVFPNSDLQPSSVLHSLRITLFLCSNHSKILSTVESFLHHKILPALLPEHPPAPPLAPSFYVSSQPSQSLPISQTLRKRFPCMKRPITSAMTLVLATNSSSRSSCHSADS